jgi:WD40 repeat protein
LYRVSSEPGRAPTLSEIGLVECPASVGALCFAPDDGALVVGSGGGLRFVQPVGGALIEAQAVHTRPVVGLAFSPDGRTLLSCDSRGALACFSVSAKRLRRW